MYIFKNYPSHFRYIIVYRRLISFAAEEPFKTKSEIGVHDNNEPYARPDQAIQ